MGPLRRQKEKITDVFVCNRQLDAVIGEETNAGLDGISCNEGAAAGIEASNTMTGQGIFDDGNRSRRLGARCHCELRLCLWDAVSH